ncbi:polysaccharide deacetylase family protein [Harryflintia acetispora]|uniref:polysaccharide deacetylase family protein n=1 Tax=Harryflintia acetispora TaxID=1849041 RepID=UPI00189A2521|nr:polysaccharide deacetylase family protein [Harryflintia acetispora]
MSSLSTADLLGTLQKDPRALEMFRYLSQGASIRVINYHNTEPRDIPRFEREIAYYAEHFQPVTVRDLDEFFATGRWPYERPGLIPAFFEGFRNHYDVVFPILEKYHFTGWFYIPSFFLDVPVPEQLEFSKAHELDVIDESAYPDGRFAMNWDELREISHSHEVCCHSGTHFQIFCDTPDEDMHREIVLAKQRLQEQLDKTVDVFCWLYGEEYGYNTRAHKYLEEAGYRYVLSNLKMEKIR